MASEITATAFLAFLKNTVNPQVSISAQFDASGNNFVHEVVTLGDEDQTLDRGDIGSIGFFLFRSPSTNTGTMTIGSDADNGYHPIVLSPGQFALGVWNNATTSDVHVWAIAGQLLEYFLIEV